LGNRHPPSAWDDEQVEESKCGDVNQDSWRHRWASVQKGMEETGRADQAAATLFRGSAEQRGDQPVDPPILPPQPSFSRSVR
jgi:hypothetical protein